ncbi:TraB/GumN family protein [Gynurincola endophyticus]|jgi:uncharacterized protein YbaP (TraB family)|uniref:TraB/GumN family protein n=1 Tax=Gynurincola endophyticus TaxID=2479004 RepID=UPI000F8D1D38|nr:TraB/GumN family protein [Gynurincola endophyticus]
MKQFITFTVALVITLTTVCVAQNKQHAAAPNSLLWEITGNGLVQPSYLLGTFHMMCASDYKMNPKVLQAINKVQKLVTEIDYLNPEEGLAMQKMMMADKKLSEQLSQAEAIDLEEVLKTYGTSLAEIDNYSPQALFSLLGRKAIPCAPAEVVAYEAELITAALKSGKKTGGLETVNEQSDFLARSYHLKEAIRQLKAGDTYAILSKEMIKAFNEENLTVLDQLVKDKRFMNAEQRKWMLSVRNENWVKMMPGMMQKESILFAVGSGHLWEADGVIQLLQAQGYTVKPVLQ